MAEKERESVSEMLGAINASDHESYAIILEQLERADKQRLMFTLDLEAFWAHVKTDTVDTDVNVPEKYDVLQVLYERAICAANYWIGAAAQIKRANETIRARYEDD